MTAKDATWTGIAVLGGAREVDITACKDRHVMSAAQQIPERVAGWFAASARSLPWRVAGTDAWAVLVSEVMLQQTPVARVLPVYAEWMQRWPTPADLAAATPGDAVRAWGKLGYPRRALRLHECAAMITDRFGGAVPSHVDELLTLPGIGSYTARAIAAFAFGQRQPVVDTNVRRVIARAVAGSAQAGPPATARDHAAALALLPDNPALAARVSAALMELGALVCTARNPQCDACPIATSCTWLTAGRPSYDGPAAQPQKFVGTDRQVRGKLLDVMRGTDGDVTQAELDAVWTDSLQRNRALASLLTDGLIVQSTADRYSLPG